GIQTQAAQQATGNGADNQRHDYVYTAQTQDEHYCYRNDHCVHGYVLFERSIAREGAYSAAWFWCCQKFQMKLFRVNTWPVHRKPASMDAVATRHCCLRF